MAEWRTGRTLGVTLYRDDVFVGHVCSAMVAAEIVETMNRVDRLLAEVRAELPPLDPSACRYCHHSPEDHAGSVGGGAMACARCPLGLCEEPRPRDAQRRSEATPQNDLLDPSRVDPYDTTKGQCADPWHDGEGVEDHPACPRCGDPYRWSCCGSADPEHLPSRCGVSP